MRNAFKEGSFCQYLGFDKNSEKDVFSWPHTRYVTDYHIKKQLHLDSNTYIELKLLKIFILQEIQFIQYMIFTKLMKLPMLLK